MKPPTLLVIGSVVTLLDKEKLHTPEFGNFWPDLSGRIKPLECSPPQGVG